ncbi:extracellular serine/threonine protein CG31145-like [Dreissena polymorpha]|uniref:FAM20 C-terminal domain-containing protein n=1 Tax=Dreissena polymorpha TaxID=45954 RepID=A0A9D4IA96_DREPO|nr:extracellular serine/threonine protein CG31145-like [Dreissena polymorpha]XP_052237365.1 extracellular serine/threonine protein CG31145-like [Dreissena polymorpha]KAH3752723.1 hypothetical protein DPMN_187349 [Dreissena polymorpha]
MMKLRARVIGAVVLGVTVLVTWILYEELSSGRTDIRHHHSIEGSMDYNVLYGHQKLQHQLQQVDLKSIRDIRNTMDINSNSQEKDYVTKNSTVLFDIAVERLLDRLELLTSFGLSRDLLRQTSMVILTRQLGGIARKRSRRLPWPQNYGSDTSWTNYRKFHHNARAAALYDPDDPAIDGLLNDMATKPFKYLEMMEKGTELKLLIQYFDGTKAVFKPMRWPRDHETLPNHFYFNDYERHNAEIAAFHLDRIFGFYRVPPVTGRFVNMTSEIFMLAGKALKKTFYVSPIGNLCFFGECSYYCDSRHSFCGVGDVIEGSLMTWLPEPPVGDRDRWRSPYRRSYSKFRKAEWEVDDTYCEGLLLDDQLLYERFMPDLIDAHIFDFITGNMDRHHIEVFLHLRNDSCPIHMDNGRGFGKTKVDEFSILAPLIQCCRIRKSTFLKLTKLYVGPEPLSELLDESLRNDPLYPILTSGFYDAVDRRVLHVLRTVARCLTNHSIKDVFIDDPF